MILTPSLKGGEGSGNFGHAGRPGAVGGSAPLDFGGVPQSNRLDSPIDEFWSQQCREKRSSLSQRWASGLNESISYSLRFGEKMSLKSETLATQMDEYFADDPARLTDPVVVYRGVGISEDGADPFANLAPGDTITDKSFVATSLSSHVASSFGSGSDIANIFVIQLDEGTPFMPGSQSEYEFVLDRDLKFEIINVSEHDASEEYSFMEPGDQLRRKITMRIAR